MNETELTAVRGDDNFWNFDVTGDLDAGDKIWFRMARKMSDLTDTAALLKKGRNVAGLSGIADVSAGTGVFQVQLEPADTVALVDDEAFVFHVILQKADVAMDTTVAQGVIRMTG
jgi:hypothetical protein